MRKLTRLAAAAVGIAASVGFYLPLTAANASTSAPAIVPQIARQGCPAGRTHLTKVYIRTGRDFCVRGTGSFNPNSNDSAFCAGNNYGHLVGHTVTGVVHRDNFAPGNVFVFTALAGGYLHLTDITITRWSGSATCP